ncbi:MAG: anhydro-N-acetylmuramic acid kinase [Limnobacter sp.]|nr:anhydro-N-acetylmuramic acid kinase [Limnobacter sp.]
MIILGAMSGTSTDGIDVAALELIEGRFRYLGMYSEGFNPQLQAALLKLQELPWLPCGQSISNTVKPEDGLTNLLLTRKALSEAYVSACEGLLNGLSLDRSKVAAVGVHGQTLRHRPDLGFTYQMIDPAWVASQLGVDVVSDFRSKDVALGGQGAPLVPAFHQAWLRSHGIQGDAAVLNLGGFSNLTVLTTVDSISHIVGGDCGPANVWMDYVMRQHFGQPFDENGQCARSGQVNVSLLGELMSHPFFGKAWPKSTGRDDFTLQRLDEAIQAAASSTNGGVCSPQDVMRTLLELCAQTVVDCLKPYSMGSLWVCGGGAYNSFLLERIQALLQANTQPTGVQKTVVARMDDLGLPVMAVEAAAFAWLAAQFLNRSAGNSVGVTGASRPAVLGSLTYSN